eukprot:1641347-Rhodomonas_salina.1
MGNRSVLVLTLFPDTPVHPCPVPVLYPAASDALPPCCPLSRSMMCVVVLTRRHAPVRRRRAGASSRAT